MTAASPPRRYFDWAATAPPGAGIAQVPFGNPSSLHAEGRAARDCLEEARSRCAAALGLKPETLYFSSGGTESNAIVILSLLLRPGAGVCLYSAVEHPSARENCRLLEKMGKTVGVIPVEADGRVSGAGLERTLGKYRESRFAAIMAVNNETGAVNDMGALCARIRKKDGPPLHVHCDMVQAAGKIPVDIAGWDIDSASLSAHKLGGPRGTGLLYLRKPLETLYRGGGQEGGIRAGTENVAGALALAACLETHTRPERLETSLRAARERLDQLTRGLEATGRYSPIPAHRTSAEDERFSPYILQAAFDGVPGEVMVRALDQAGFAVSTGSACSSGTADRPVLAAMGLGPKPRLEGIRISQGWSTTPGDIEALVQAVGEVLRYL
ncbi:MAG: aminotransferase class V-fold PLP-dependent enzyme [Treponema sp.]|jgi:cysteine desulfurase|nr:aminotransferase class V-fold PLP-dependent enzyme [Treponema sp.]